MFIGRSIEPVRMVDGRHLSIAWIVSVVGLSVAGRRGPGNRSSNAGDHADVVGRVRRAARQNVDVTVEAVRSFEGCTLKVCGGDRLLAEAPVGALTAGVNRVSCFCLNPRKPQRRAGRS
jgi:hypothetical protein